MDERKKCPYCGEEILAIAKKCKHCGTWIVDKEEQAPTSIQRSKRCDFCGCIIPQNSEKCPKCGEWLVDEKTESFCGYGFKNPIVMSITIFMALVAFIILLNDGIEPAMVIVIGAFFVYVYLLPSIIAKARNHPQFIPIMLINIIFGETVIGWVVSLIWATSHRMGRHTHW